MPICRRLPHQMHPQHASPSPTDGKNASTASAVCTTSTTTPRPQPGRTRAPTSLRPSHLVGSNVGLRRAGSITSITIPGRRLGRTPLGVSSPWTTGARSPQAGRCAGLLMERRTLSITSRRRRYGRIRGLLMGCRIGRRGRERRFPNIGGAS